SRAALTAFFHVSVTTVIYTLSLHDALPILNQAHRRRELSALFASDRISLFPCPGSVIVNKLPGMQSPISIPGLPVALSWQVPPVSGRIDGGVLTVAAGERTDMFIDPAGGEPVLTAPRLLGPA